MSELKSDSISRRKAGKVIAAAGAGLTVGFVTPKTWSRPWAELGVLPAHAQTSAGSMLQTTPAELTFSHTVGSTECPQKVGTLTVTNNTANEITWGATVPDAPEGPSPTLEFGDEDATEPNNPLGTGTIPAMSSIVLTLWFNCVTATSFMGDVEFTSTDLAGVSSTVKITANIMSGAALQID